MGGLESWCPWLGTCLCQHGTERLGPSVRTLLSSQPLVKLPHFMGNWAPALVTPPLTRVSLLGNMEGMSHNTEVLCYLTL